MIPHLDDDQHERLWRICDALVSGSGARAAIVCDAANGSVIVSVGDTTAAGAATGVQLLGPGERVVHGASGQIYGIDIPGGALLAVLHEPAVLENVRAAAAEAMRQAAELLASLPPPTPPQTEHVHPHEPPKPKTKKKTTTKRKPAASRSRSTKKKGSAKKAKPSKTAKKKKISPRPRRPAPRPSTRI